MYVQSLLLSMSIIVKAFQCFGVDGYYSYSKYVPKGFTFIRYY